MIRTMINIQNSTVIKTIANRKTIVRTIAILAIAITAGCEQGEHSKSTRNARMHSDDRFVAFVGIGEDDDIWPVLRASARRLQNELEPGIPLRTVAPEHTSVNEQRKILDKLADEGMGALAIQVTDPGALVETLNAMTSRGIQVVTIGRRVQSDSPFVHCGIQDKLIGEKIADALAECIRDKGTVAILHADASDPASAKRRRAFEKRLTAHNQVTAILDFDCGGSPVRARKIIRETMRRYPRLSGWAVMGNWPLLDHDGERILPSTCSMVGVDPLPSTWDAIEDANVHAMVTSDYEALAKHALTTSLSHVIGRVQLSTNKRAEVKTIFTSTLTEFKAKWMRLQSELPESRP